MDDLTTRLNKASDKINEASPSQSKQPEHTTNEENIVAKFGKFCVANGMVMPR